MYCRGQHTRTINSKNTAFTQHRQHNTTSRSITYSQVEVHYQTFGEGGASIAGLIQQTQTLQSSQRQASSLLTLISSSIDLGSEIRSTCIHCSCTILIFTSRAFTWMVEGLGNVSKVSNGVYYYLLIWIQWYRSSKLLK